MDVICEKCARRQVYCGCDLEMSNPPFAIKYSRSYMTLKQKISNFEPQNYRWVVVELNAGFGNQLLTLVNGLQLALMTGRILLIRKTFSPNHHGVVASTLDSVLPWMSTSYIEQHDVKLGPEKVINLWTKSGLAFLICKNWTEELHNFSTLLLPHGVQDVHLSHANWAFGAALRATFHSLDFFFLSHFFWTGRQELSLPVLVETLPRPQPWDGTRHLAALIRDLRAARPARLIGVHVRITSNHFCIVDTFNYPGGVDPADGNASGPPPGPAPTDFCFSSSLASVAACLRSVADGPRGAPPPVVLWAADSDSLSADLLRAAAALPGARVVRLRHAADARYDAGPRAALLDLLLLSEADALVAAAWSTYSYAAHARGPYAAHYPAFRAPGAPGAPCAPAAGPEAGLLGFGPGFDGCAHAGPARLVCRAWRAECTAALMGDGATGCLESLLADCPAGPAGAAAALRAATGPHVGGFDAARLAAQVHAKPDRAVVYHLYMFRVL